MTEPVIRPWPPAQSDVDFLVEFETLPDGTYADAYVGLPESLETLLQRPVDLVVTTAITNPYFRQSIDETKTLVYAACIQEVPARHSAGRGSPASS